MALLLYFINTVSTHTQVEVLDDPELKHGFQIISTCKSFRLDTSTMEERHQWLQVRHNLQFIHGSHSCF